MGLGFRLGTHELVPQTALMCASVIAKAEKKSAGIGISKLTNTSLAAPGVVKSRLAELAQGASEC
jgi:hypothetical protein